MLRKQSPSLIFVTDNVKGKKIVISDKLTRSKQDKLIHCVQKHIIEKGTFYWNVNQYNTNVNKNNTRALFTNKEFQTPYITFKCWRSVKTTHINHSKHLKWKIRFKNFELTSFLGLYKIKHKSIYIFREFNDSQK